MDDINVTVDVPSLLLLVCKKIQKKDGVLSALLLYHRSTICAFFIIVI